MLVLKRLVLLLRGFINALIQIICSREFLYVHHMEYFVFFPCVINLEFLTLLMNQAE